MNPSTEPPATSAREAYDSLAAALARGEEIDAATVAEIIAAAGCTFAELSRDVVACDQAGVLTHAPAGE